MSEGFKWGEFSPKQLQSMQESTARINFWVGAVRSGKTIASIVRWLAELRAGPPGKMMMVGRTERTIKRNVLDVIEQIVGPRNFKFSHGTGECVIYGRKIDIVGANDAQAEKKIQGATLAGAYVDEVTVIPESAFKMLLSRLSVRGARLFGTMNPDSPFHWVKTEYIDNDQIKNKRIFHFTLEDNLTLDPEYVEAIKQEYTGLWYDRFILGKWVMAEGVVYKDFDDNKHTFAAGEEPEEFDDFRLWVDFGTTNPTAMLLVGVDRLPNGRERYWVLDEHYHKPDVDGDKGVDEQYRDMINLIERNGLAGVVKYAVVDAAAKPFILEIRKRGKITPIKSDKDVLEGIHEVSKALRDERLLISKRCVNTLKEFATYVWDSKAALKGKDQPVKANDHALDAIRYGVMTPPPSVVRVISADPERERMERLMELSGDEDD